MNKKLLLVSLVLVSLILSMLMAIEFKKIVEHRLLLSKYEMIDMYVEQGYVPDEETAIKITKAIFSKLFSDVLEDMEPLKATYDKKFEVWFVYGTYKPVTMGVAPRILIRKKDGKILGITYMK